MIGAKMLAAFNKHIGKELYSSNLYLALGAWCDTHTYKGFARWLRAQAAEEHGHALKMLDFVLERGGEVALGAVEAPPRSFASVQAVFDAVLIHERAVSKAIDALHALAAAEKDAASQVFLQWFVSEQVEEEANASEIAEKLRMIGDKPATILYLDKEYGKRGSKS
jgi:ferritin